MVNVGQFNRLLKIRRASKERDAIGGEMTVYNEIGQVYASKKISQANLSVDAEIELINQRFTYMTHISNFTRNLDYEDLIDDGGEEYKIEGIDHLPADLPRFTQIVASRRGTN